MAKRLKGGHGFLKAGEKEGWQDKVAKNKKLKGDIKENKLRILINFFRYYILFKIACDQSPQRGFPGG